MKLTVNGVEIQMQDDITIKAFLENRGLNPGAVVVELNYDIPPREKWNDIVLKDGDTLEIVKFIGGG